MQIRAPRALSAGKAIASFSYQWPRLPDLKYLPTQLGHYVYQHLGVNLKLGLPLKPEEDSDLDHVFRTYLVQDNDKSNIVTFGSIAIRSEHSLNTLEVQCVY